MTRLTRGELARKITTSGLLSLLLLNACPALSQGAYPLDPGDVNIKTIAPASVAAPPAIPASAPVSNQSPEVNIPAKPAPQQIAQKQAPPAGSALRFTPVSSDAGSVDPATSGTDGSGSMKIEPAAPLASADPASSNAKAVTPPEVTDPQPLAQQLPPAAIPGSTGPQVAGKLVDKHNAYLPTTVGQVQIRRPFKLFAKEELIRNLSFRDTPVREVIAELARRGGLNILIDQSVRGNVTGDLKDLTLNEAMDSVLAAAGYQHRNLDNATVIVGTMQAMTELGLNRPMARAFKLSYAHPFDVAVLLHTSVFNRGMAAEFTTALRKKNTTDDRNSNGSEGETRIESDLQSLGEGGAKKGLRTAERKSNTGAATDEGQYTDENNQTGRLELNRQVRGTSRSQTQEGVGFNNASTDPGSQQIRQFQEVPTDYTVEQNGGGAIVIPDVKNRQVIVVGTPDDIAVAEQAIHFIDKRPKQVHIQASLIEISNQGIRQLGAQLNLQGAGLSGTILGPGFQPLIQSLPGLGSPARPGPVVTDTAAFGPNSTSTQFNSSLGQNMSTNNNTTFASTTNPPFANTTTTNTSVNNPTFTSTLATAIAQAFTRTQSYTLNPQSLQSQPIFGGSTVTTPSNTAGYTGLLGALFPLITSTIAGVAPLATAQSGFNFLTLSKSAGGRANIATLPAGLGLNLQMLLQTNKAKIVANPAILVNDNTEAMIVIADEVLHKITSVATITSVTTNVELTKAGVFLDVLPRVAEDGFISMRLRPQVSAPLTGPQTFGTAPNQTTVTLLSIRDVMSQELRIKDGQTLVIGGLFEEQEQAQLAKVPYLAELPVMGALFRNTLKGRNRTELMLLITPKVVEEEPPAVSEGSSGPRQM